MPQAGKTKTRHENHAQAASEPRGINAASHRGPGRRFLHPLSAGEMDPFTIRRRVRPPPPRNNFIAAPSRNLGGAAHNMDPKEDKQI